MMKRKFHILAIDDSATNNMLLEAVLKDEGYSIDTLGASKNAIQTINKKTPDLILLDIMMPGIDGIKILEYLQSNEETKDIPVIIISARTDNETIRKAEKFRIKKYIKKPIDLSLLTREVNKVFKNSENH